jgi:hypothetical protein
MFVARCVECLGRIVLIPIVCVIYFITFSDAYNYTTSVTTFIVIGASVLYVSIREYSGLKSAGSNTLKLIEAKAARFDSLSNLELLVLNWCVHSVISTSMRHHMMEKQRQSNSREISGQKPIDDSTRNPFASQESDRRVMEGSSLFAL